MAGELATSRRKLERSTIELERKHLEVEGRRRYIETILERIATGVVSVDAAGAITHDQQRGGAAARPRSRDASGQPARAVFDRAGSAAARARCSPAAAAARAEPPAQEIALTRDGQRAAPGRGGHAAASATSGAPEGVVLVFDDVTPLIRAQKVAAWREVARRLAHEIKNPLTPIQLSAERLRRHFAGAAGRDARARRRVHDDDRRRGRVAEGAGRRVLAVRADAGAADGADRSARSCSTTRWRSTTASSADVRIEQRFAPDAAAASGSIRSRSGA